jgi:hypothetical protein
MRTILKIDGPLARILGLAGAILLSAGVVTAGEWKIETVDAMGPGQFSSLKVDKLGNVHVAYVPDIDSYPLRYAFWDHTVNKWFTMAVAGGASFCTLVLDSRQQPHISYADHGTGLGARLRHAFWDGNWNIRAIDIQAGAVVAYYTSIALDARDRPVFSFYDYADPTNRFRLRLRSVFWMGDYWKAITADPQMGSGKFNSIAMDATGRPHIAYANVSYETSSLRYASWNGETWTTQTVEGASGPFPVYSVSMVLDKNDDPHIVYTDVERRLVKYATRRAGVWQIQVVDSVRGPAYPDRSGLALDNQGNLYLSYYDEGPGILKIASRVNGKWMAEIVDRNGSGFTSSVGIDGDVLWVSYADNTERSLKVAHRTLERPASARQLEGVSVSKVGKK